MTQINFEKAYQVTREKYLEALEEISELKKTVLMSEIHIASLEAQTRVIIKK